MTAAQRMTITRELGPRVMKAAEQIQFRLNTYGKADASLWRNLLTEIHATPEGEKQLSTSAGQIFQLAILGRLQNGNDDASLRRREPGGGFPNRRQF